MATFVLLEEARLALQGMGMGSRSRKATCLEIKGRTEARLQATGFTTAFTTAKAELSRYLTAHGTARAAKGAPLSEEVKAIRHARFANTRLLQFANLIAIGDPGSSERRTQLERLYKSRRPELGVHINFSNREQWFNWMDSRTRGVSYVTSIISAVTSTFSAGERGIYIRSLGLPINATQAQIEEASRQRQAQLRASRAASASFRAAQQTRALTSHGRNADSVLSAANLPLEGQEVTRHEGSGTFSFFGTVNDKPVRIVVNASSTILKRNPRLSFRDDGLALTAEDGADLGVIVSSATMPFLKTHGHNLFTVWKAEVERRIGRPLAPHETGQLPAPAGQDPNLPAWAARRKLYKIKPVRQDGALWLFRQWLDEEFPDAVNEIRHHWEDASLPFTTRFPTWITEHYPDHPWAAWWRAYMLDPPHTRKKTDTVRGCVVALRGEVTSNKQYLVSAGVSGKVWVFGPPRDDEDLE
ncbi:uncharacterized protein EV422DRAFT_547967 [Fimicolochytrium jonesii]|uniref:uncharacterized protein n=1 Tax=Fimicolochytrium jonesii TaxID=1396493 RepID=UPI0022FECF0E|nr:uncharacterized protein EV422DRAFT_547967 [Fimicolochytrium jonesii]KAI8815887.1 hypothetical protein EV422DRAFT_547967 [Fimicolochytrium jonesii]